MDPIDGFQADCDGDSFEVVGKDHVERVVSQVLPRPFYCGDTPIRSAVHVRGDEPAIKLDIGLCIRNLNMLGRTLRLGPI